MEKDLKPEHRVFAHQYVIDWNATRSYKVAYPNAKTSTAEVNGSKLLRNTKVAAYIEEIQKDLGKLAGVSALRNVLELKKIAFTNIADFKDGWMTEKQFDDLDEDTKAALSEIQYQEKSTKDGVERIVKFKLHDKLRSIETLNKMLGFNAPEKHENKNLNTSVPISDWVNGTKKGSSDMDRFNPDDPE
jgi:phage terminase small subunit